MTKELINRRLFIAGAAAGMATNLTAQTADLPSGPIRIVLPFTAGGGPDISARLIAQYLTKQTGVAAAVENRTGANGIIASQVVATAAPNGNTLLYTTGSHAINPSVYKKLPYDTVADFAPVSLINVSPCLVLVVAPNYSARTFADFVRMARQPDSRIAFGSPGIGNTPVSSCSPRLSTGIRFVPPPARHSLIFVYSLISISPLVSLTATPKFDGFAVAAPNRDAA